ncbi:serine kinase [Pararhodobacter sp.]|uniref:HPr kinase/phosphorylase n=1 Tax=Pararhodobacter sp. TaxID=2127056 RepID=UPI002AFEBF82|nr:serine kinase [Pararhodobacter sp.]
MTAAPNVHASAVAFGPHAGVLITGASGSGKSQLAMALIGEGAQLVSDDQVLLTALNGTLFARAPHSIAGMIEVRGLGIVTMTYRRLAQIVLVVDLDRPASRRLPDPLSRLVRGVTLPCLAGRPDTPFARGISHYLLP